jgi:EmrB/QacA subfamily drug resistance transporter
MAMVETAAAQAQTRDQAKDQAQDQVPGRRREVMVVLPGLLLAILLAMLDNMIVGTALPKIVGQLGGLDQISWVVTAYVLGTTVSTPLWGKIGDLYGRKNIFLTSIVIFLVGSALSGMSQTMGQLIGFRALQGLGAGGLMVGAMAIIGDLVPPRERGRYQGFMASVMGLAMIGGPLVGGVITDHLSWRWAFYVNLPLGAIALFLLVTKLHLPKYRTEHRIDWLGAGLLSVGITALVLITSWGGHRYAWGSAQILWLGVIGVLALVAFGFAEHRAAEPVLSLNLFRNRNFALISAIGFLLGFTMFGAMNFLPLFMQTVQGESATASGLMLLPMMVGMMAVSLVVGNMITKTGRYKIYPVIGGVVMTLGIILLARLDVNTSKLELAIFMIVLGAGMGFLMQTSMLIAQNSVEQKDLGVASSSAAFFRSIGGSFGVSLFGTLFIRVFNDDLTRSFGSAAAKATGGNGQVDPEALRRLPDAVRLPIQSAIADGLGTVFVWAIPFAAIVAVVALFIKHIALRTGPTHATPDDDGPEAPALVAAAE